MAADDEKSWTYEGRAYWLFGGVAVLLLFLGVYWARTSFSDDAYISLRYVERALDGKGLTWTAGDRVEGYTHPLWVLMLLPMGASGMDLVDAARWLGIFHLVALAALWWNLRLPQTGLWLLLTIPAVLHWSLGGLEGPAFGFWSVWAAYLAIDLRERGEAPPVRAFLVGSVSAGAALMRPEGMGLAVLTLLWIALGRRWKVFGQALAGFGLFFGGWEVFRLAYYGDPLPNTAYAKVGGFTTWEQLGRAWEYIKGSEVLEMWLPTTVACLVVLVLGRKETRAWLVAAAATPVVASIAVSGGDHMAYVRMLVPVLIVLVFAAGFAFRGVPLSLRPVAIGAFAFGIGWQANQLWRDRDVEHVGWVALIGEQVGRYFSVQLPPGSLVATATAGSIPYFAQDLEFIDTLGLNDRHIARREVTEIRVFGQSMPGHLKGDGDYVLARKPDVVLFGSARGKLLPSFLTDVELLENPAFREQYAPYRIEVPVPPGAVTPGLAGYVKNGTTPVEVYLRKDSIRVAALRKVGRPLGWPRWPPPEPTPVDPEL